MKKVLSALLFLAVTGFTKLQAQIVNNDFESWKLDTFYLPADTIGTLPADTIVFNSPLGWTTVNVLTALDSFGGRALVTQTNHAYSGSSAIEMTTDTVTVPPGLIHSLPITSLTVPGFALNGSFGLSTKVFTNSSVVSPGSVAGAGQPFTQRLATFNGFYNYAPVLQASTGVNDTCVIWAALRKGPNVVANAIFKSTASTDGYRPFSAGFEYLSCETPDTLVILLTSSAPNVESFLIGLQPGSVLQVDSLYYTLLPENYAFAPFANPDLFTVYENQTDTLNVLANDSDCSGSSLTVSLASAPHHGTATVLNNNIIYIPNAGFLGLDSMFYQDINLSGDSSITLCQVFVNQSLGISQINRIAVNIYPVPTSNELTVQFENPGQTKALIYDLTGRLVLAQGMNKNTKQLNIELLANGLYNLQIVNEQGEIIGIGKFAVAR